MNSSPFNRTGLRLEKLTLRRFRGATTATEIQFDSQKSLVFIGGENGTGKSTIVDALDFVCNRSAGSIEDRSSTRAREHLPALGHTVREMSVELTVGSQRFVAAFAGARIQVTPETGLPVAHVLRRSRLLSLVEAAPSERYKQLQRFIDVTDVERGEQALRNALNEAAREFEQQARRQNAAEAELDHLWIAEGRPGAPQPAVAWAAQKVAAAPTAARCASEQLQTVIARLDAAARVYAAQQDAAAALQQAEARLLECRAAITAAASADAAAGLELLQLLRSARDYLAAPTVVCPVCERPAAADDLRRRINTRLEQMTSLGRLHDQRAAAAQAQQRAAAVAAQTQADGERAVAALTAAMDESALPRLQTLAARTVDLGAADRLAAVQAARAALVAEQQERQKDWHQFNSLKVLYEQLSATAHAAHAADARRLKLERALEIVHRERLLFTQRVLDSVRDECNRLYALIHPGESPALQRLYLDEKRKASLEQRCSFEDETAVAPQAYFSESHLDTLGFCLWLAVAKLTGGGDALIVLDDVFTATDAEHFARILELLVAESEHFAQVIVTTHDRRLRELFATGRIPSARCQFIELQSWSRAQGIKPGRAKPNVAELRTLLNAAPFDGAGVAAPAGAMAVSLLDWLTDVYQCPLPRRRNQRYTLGELCAAVAGLADKLKIERRSNKPHEIALRPLIQSLAEQADTQAGDADSKRFAQATLGLIEAILCPTCGGAPQKRQATHWACSCGHTRMTPLAGA